MANEWKKRSKIVNDSQYKSSALGTSALRCLDRWFKSLGFAVAVEKLFSLVAFFCRWLCLFWFSRLVNEVAMHIEQAARSGELFVEQGAKCLFADGQSLGSVGSGRRGIGS